MAASVFWTRIGLIASGVAVVLCASDAHAVLTDSEKGQVRGYVASGDLGAVSKLRSLVARPDLSESEIGEVLASALRTTAFDDRCERFVQALLFGPASIASRSAVAPAVVGGLLARADTVMAGQPGNPNQWAIDARDELVRIYRYVPKMMSEARDSERRGVASLETRAQLAIGASFQQHLARHATFFGFGRPAEGAALMLRLLVARTAVLVGADTANREELADSIGLGSAARGLFVRTGVLIDDGGMGPEVRLAEIVRMVESVPRATQGLSVVLVSKTPAGSLSMGDELMAIRSPLGPVAPRRQGLWPDAVVPAEPEQALAEAAFVASWRSARLLLAADPQLAALVGAAMGRAAGKGSFGHLAGWIVDASLDRDAATSERPVSPELLLAATMTQLLLDANRTVELAAMRMMAGRPEPAEQLLLGLRALATPTSSGAATAQLGHLTDGAVELQQASLVMDGASVKAVRWGGHEISFALGQNGQVTDLSRDGKPLRLGDLKTIRIPTTAGDRWQAGARTFVRLNGAPRVGVVGDAQLVLQPAASDSTGFDAVYTEAPSADHAVEATLQVTGDAGAGQIVRASTGTASYQGVALLLRCDNACFARLVSVDGEGHEKELARETKVSEGPSSDGVRVRLSIRGQDVTAKVDGKPLRGRLGQPMAPGHVGWMVRPGSQLVIRDWAIESAP